LAFRRGYSAELELVHLLRQQGFYSVRVPISGGRGFPCDVLASRNRERRAYEVKSTKNLTIYLYESDLSGLKEFSENFDFEPYIAVRWKFAKKNPWTFKLISDESTLKISRGS